MRFVPNTIEHLGVRMYSTLPPVIAELIANSYDADANNVHIWLRDGDEKEIEVYDDGLGMSFEEINNEFLVIGRNRRIERSSDTSPGGRKIIGKKGLGKLSFFGIASQIEIITVKDGLKNSFVMDWDKIVNADKNDGFAKDYEPELIAVDESTKDARGTKIILKKIKKEIDLDPDALADNVAKYFIVSDDFNIKISHNGINWIKLDNKRRYSALDEEIKWSVPDEIEFPDSCKYAHEITGQILATQKPIPPKTGMRGVTLFSRNKLVNLPDYFSDSTSSHFFSYLTGWLEVDFIDDLDEDVITTNRQSLNWDHPEMQELRLCLRDLLNWLEKDWRGKRREIRKKNLADDFEKKHNISISEWQKLVPESVNKSLTPLLEKLVSDSELSGDEIKGAVRHLRDIAPEYTNYHYRHLHPTLNKEVGKRYRDEEYYDAVTDGVKRYVSVVRKKTKSDPRFTDLDEISLLTQVFKNNKNGPIWSVVSKHIKPDGESFTQQTKDAIATGHHKLAMAIWEAFRNPPAHESHTDLEESGLYTEMDCLDALSLLSHLFRRLDDLEKI